MNSFRQFAKDKESVVAFVPARVAHRQQFQTDVNRQQTVFGQNGIQNEQQTQELQRKSLFFMAYWMNFVLERSTNGIWPNPPRFHFSS